MKVLILGFEDLQELDNTMEALIEQSQCFRFSVVCGGTDSCAYKWVQSKGAPVIFSQAKSPQDLIKEADYLVIRLKEESPIWHKNLMMKWKMEGKHGTVIR